MGEVAAIPRPSGAEIVTEERLRILSSSFSAASMTRAFGGASDPTRIWDAMVRNSPEAFAFYFDLEEKDDDIGGLLETLKLAVLSRERSIEPYDDSQPAQEVADFVSEQLDSISSFHQVLHALLDAPGYGLSIAEINYDITGSQVGVSAINDCPQELFTFAEQRYLPQVGPLRFLSTPYTVSGGVLVPEEKFLIFSYNPRKRNRFGRPLLRRAFWPSWFKRNALRFWLRFAEKGPGTAAVKYKSGATEDEKNQALEAAEALIEKIAIALPENFELVESLLTSARAQNPAVYEHMVERCELAIARAVLGQTLTSHGSDGSAGSLALGQVHKEMFHQREVELARALEQVINDQLIRRLVIWNFGPNAPMPHWCIDTDDPDDLSVRIKIDQILQQMGVPFTENYARGTYGIPEPAAGDEILQPRGMTANPLDPGTPGTPSGVPAFSDARVRKDTEDVHRLMEQMRSQSVTEFRTRIREIADEVKLGRGGIQ